MSSTDAVWLEEAGDSGNAATRLVVLERIVPVLIAAVVLVVAIVTVAPWPVGVFQDDAIYVTLAKALASGEGYRMINMPGSPHATHYPPGYPLVLAGLWRLWPSFPDNVVLFKFANALFVALAAVGSYWFGRERLGLGTLGGSLGALVGTASIVVMMLTGVVLSEPLFMVLLLPTLFASERAVESGRLRDAVAAGALIGALGLVRTVGALVLPAAALVLVTRRRWRTAVALSVACAVFLVPWQLWVTVYQGEIPHPFVGKYGAYGSWLVEGYREGGVQFARAVLARNADDLFGFLGYLTLPVGPYWPRLGSLATVLGILVIGGIAVRRAVPVTLLFVAIYTGVILVWPFEPMRFILALWPVLVPLFVAGVASVARWRRDRPRAQPFRMALAAATAVVVAGYVTYNVRGFRGRWWSSMQRDISVQAKPIADWVGGGTRPDDVLVTDHDLIVYLYTGRRAVPTVSFTARSRVRPLSTAEDAMVLRSILAMYKPRFFIAGSKQAIDAANVLAAEATPRLRYVGSIRTALIYEPVSE